MSPALSGVEGLILDLDGVLTDTADTHRRAWKRMFDEFLSERDGGGAPFTDADYRRHVDGKPRYEGAESFLESRGIELPYGDPDDPPGGDTVCGLGNRKNRYFLELLEEEGVERIEPAVEWTRHVAERDMPLAVVTSSRNGRRVLSAAGLEALFEVRVDGKDGEELGLPGKPDPAYFLEAARRLGVEPDRTAVVEDAEAGVEAGVRGGFGLVVGVAGGDRTARERLSGAGADILVDTLAGLPLPETDPRPRPIRDLPLFMDEPGAVDGLREGSTSALFLDCDGTLAPIVEDPTEARIPDATREALRRARGLFPLAVVSGRDLEDLRRLVSMDGIYYAGSHGLHTREPDGTEHERAGEFLPDLDRAESRLREELGDMDGVTTERKRFAIAVHYRRAADEEGGRVQSLVRAVEEGEPRLRISAGKKVVELRPDLEWDKGSALRWLLDLVEGRERRLRPVYIGDDVTDEDAFRTLPPRGIGLVVKGEEDGRETLASAALADTGEVGELIEELTAEGGGSRRV